MQVRPEVNLIVGACTNEVNAVPFGYNSIRAEMLLLEMPMAPPVLTLDI
jgi:hypothetical protein